MVRPLTPQENKLITHLYNEYAPLIEKHIAIFKKKGRLKDAAAEGDTQENALRMAGLHALMEVFARHDPAQGHFNSLLESRIRGKMGDIINESSLHTQIPKSFISAARNANTQAKQATQPAAPQPTTPQAASPAPASPKPAEPAQPTTSVPAKTQDPD